MNRPQQPSRRARLVFLAAACVASWAAVAGIAYLAHTLTGG